MSTNYGSKASNMRGFLLEGQPGRCQPVRARGRRLTCRTRTRRAAHAGPKPMSRLLRSSLHVTGVNPTVCKSVNRRHDGIGFSSDERYLRFAWKREAGRAALLAIKWPTGQHARLIYTAPGLPTVWHEVVMLTFVLYCTPSLSRGCRDRT
jgi:hypothetical protein